jgi:preprotein translocase subunit SecY
MLIVFRFGAHIPVPFLSKDAMDAFLTSTGGGMNLFNLFDTFTGGAFRNATVLAMGVSPYINASIIIQLLTVAIPSLESVLIRLRVIWVSHSRLSRAQVFM